jgi:uracil-DNA glycosylase
MSDEVGTKCLVLDRETLKRMSVASVFMLEIAGTDWGPIFGDPKVREGLEFVSRTIAKTKTEYIPSSLEVPSAFVLTPWKSVRVVIFGQDPYPQPGVPTGLAFSVRRDVRLTRSLESLFHVYSKTLGYPTPRHGCLNAWAIQGVLLLNTALTVKPNASNSHTQTWFRFTEPLIRAISNARPLVWVLLGGEAQKLRTEIKGDGHAFVVGPHPVARDNSFLATDIYNEVNACLKKRGEAPIAWKLDD